MTKHRPFSDYYIFQFSDGTWRIAPKTDHDWNGMPDLPRDYNRPYQTQDMAKAALANAVSIRTAIDGVQS